MKNFSIVVPVFNEVDNINILLQEIFFIFKNIESEYEVIIVDDCSKDNTAIEIKTLKSNKKITYIKHKINKGQSHALLTGIINAKFQTIVTLDGDCQNDPKDIPKLLEIYFSNEKLKLIGGLRLKRKDNIIKIFSSIIANKIRSIILHDRCIDTGCSLKVFDKSIFLSFPFFDGIHRFLPALFLGYGHFTDFVAVNHRLRKFGKSKYGTMDRLFKGIADTVRVKLIINRYIKQK